MSCAPNLQTPRSQVVSQIQRSHYQSRFVLGAVGLFRIRASTTLENPEKRDRSDSEELDKLHIPGIGSRSVES
jgi:hypothetical protein